MSHTARSAGSLHVVARGFGISPSSRSATLVPSFLGRRLFSVAIAKQESSSPAESHRGGRRAAVVSASRPQSGEHCLTPISIASHCCRGYG